MKELLELTEDLGISRPVFRLSISDSRGRIDASKPIYSYKPTAIPDNILSELVVSNYYENFSTHNEAFSINKRDIAGKAMNDIRESMATFIANNLEMRNPRQSKLYKWLYRNMPNNSDFNDMLVMVYKYLRSFTGNDMRSTSATHTNNAIALLTAIEEKYNERR